MINFISTVLGIDKLNASLLSIGIFLYSRDGYINEHDVEPIYDSILKEFDSWAKFKEQIKINCGYTMIGHKRLENIKYCIEQSKNIEGDIIECGVWRGGAMMYAKQCLLDLNINKKIFLADSFCGLPEPSLPEDQGLRYCDSSYLSVSLEETLNNFKKFNLLDDNIKPIVGWFKNTLPLFNNKLSIIRLDGDLFESTMDSLVNLYPLLSIGGYIIIDDYHIVNACKKATDQYRANNNITTEIISIDRDAIFWQKI